MTFGKLSKQHPPPPPPLELNQVLLTIAKTILVSLHPNQKKTGNVRIENMLLLLKRLITSISRKSFGNWMAKRGAVRLPLYLFFFSQFYELLSLPLEYVDLQNTLGRPSKTT